jgi:hypothetical protein
MTETRNLVIDWLLEDARDEAIAYALAHSILPAWHSHIHVLRNLRPIERR